MAGWSKSELQKYFWCYTMSATATIATTKIIIPLQRSLKESFYLVRDDYSSVY